MAEARRLGFLTRFDRADASDAIEEAIERGLALHRAGHVAPCRILRSESLEAKRNDGCGTFQPHCTQRGSSPRLNARSPRAWRKFAAEAMRPVHAYAVGNAGAGALALPRTGGDAGDTRERRSHLRSSGNSFWN